MWAEAVPLGRVLRRSLEPVVLDPTEPYKQITVRLHHRGAVLRVVQQGSEIGSSRQYRARSGQLILSRIDARNGAIGLVPPDLDGAVVTSDFWLFDVDEEQIDSAYLDFYVWTKTFVDLCRQASEGTTNRVRLQPDAFLQLPIPLPLLAEQRRLVAQVAALAARVEAARGLRRAVAEAASRLLMVMAHRPDLSEAEKRAAGWRWTAIGDVARRIAESVSVEVTEAYPNLGILSFAKGVFDKPPIEGATTSARVLYRVRKGQFIYSRLFAFEGAYATVPDQFDGFMVSNEFPTFALDEHLVLPEFMSSYFLDSRVWNTVAAGSKGLGDRRQRVHPEQVEAHHFWLPPLEWQRTLAETHGAIAAVRQAQAETAAALDALLPAILDRAFRGEL